MKLNKIFKLTCLSALLMASTQGYVQARQHNTNNETTVNENHANKYVTEGDRTPEEDAIIAKSIKKHIKSSKVLSKLNNVNVESKNGVVHFTGTVDSDTQVEHLVELAQTIIGVNDVNVSDLEVKDGKHPIADALTTAKIKGLLIREKLFGEKDIAAINTEVETKDGVVYLSGVLDNKSQIDNAIAVIKKHVPEVKKVEYKVDTKAHKKGKDIHHTYEDNTSTTDSDKNNGSDSDKTNGTDADKTNGTDSKN